jgi:hypothetical protein
VSDEDEVDDLMNEIKSEDDESVDAERSDSGDDSYTERSDIEDSSSYSEAEEYKMSDDDDSMGDDGGSMITQAEVYDNLKRIGELEDEKQKIQDELRERTEQLRSMLKHIDRGSILYKMLQSALPAPPPKAAAAANPTKKSAPKAAPKKAAKKKRK